ncbi:cache domain-containing protein [Methanosarcina sp. Mfa9]|uniref:cache domain-containing protein n=1 Tax=Methanosarcina sp. Mfa9 TaxID=3439063 RepID=UPI003F84EBED
MNLIKFVCGMLAVALVLGILTSGSPDDGNQDNSTVSLDGNGSETEGAIRAEETETEGTGEGEREISPSGEAGTKELAATEPSMPGTLMFGEGKSDMAGQQRYIEARVKATAGLIEEEGEKIFSDFREEGSSWYHHNFYIFVWETDGTAVVYPPDESMEGQDLDGLQDSNGKPIGELFIETALNKKGEGWVDYYWPKPGEDESVLKYSFIRKVNRDGQDYLVGAGFYADDYLISRNLDECKVLSRDGGIYVSELLHPENFDRELDLDYSIAHSVIEPGENNAPHLMSKTEVHYILEGEGTLYIDGIPVKLRPGQLIYIPEDSIQCTYNTGNTSLEFLAINQPAWDEDNEEIFD